MSFSELAASDIFFFPKILQNNYNPVIAITILNSIYVSLLSPTSVNAPKITERTESQFSAFEKNACCGDNGAFLCVRTQIPPRHTHTHTEHTGTQLIKKNHPTNNFQMKNEESEIDITTKDFHWKSFP